MNRRSLLIGAGAAALTASAPLIASPRFSSPLFRPEDLEGLILQTMQKIGGLPGLAVAVVSPDGSYANGFGVADIGTGERVTATTAFYIASSTKPLTALALAAMAGRGELDLGATLASFAPDAPFPASVRPGEVTLRHLLTHSSGLSCDPVAFRLAFSGRHDPELLWHLLGTSQVNTEAPLGTFDYTNTGYNIATLLTDHVVGKLWQDLLQAEIFDPADMTRTSARMSLAFTERWSIARPHIAQPDGLVRSPLEKSDRTMHSAGGVLMSADDAARWLELMTRDGAGVIARDAILATRKPLARLSATFGDYDRSAYGLGWYHVMFRDELMLQHFGSFAGARAHVSYLPQRRIGVAVFMNESGPASQLADILANYVYDAAAGRTEARSRFDAAIDALIALRQKGLDRMREGQEARARRASTLTRPPEAYAGRYTNAAYGDIEIASEGGRLSVTFGAMHALADFGEAPDAIRVELIPGSGEIINFDGATPATLTYDGNTYTRA